MARVKVHVFLKPGVLDVQGKVYGGRAYAHFIALDNMIDHAQPVRFFGGPGIGGKQEFLGLACTQFPRMSEPFNARDAKIDHGIGKQCIFRCYNDVTNPCKNQRTCNAFALNCTNRRL